MDNILQFQDSLMSRPACKPHTNQIKDRSVYHIVATTLDFTEVPPPATTVALKSVHDIAEELIVHASLHSGPRLSRPLRLNQHAILLFSGPHVANDR